jgi:Zn ribbon nucleic-acid-binding protein
MKCPRCNRDNANFLWRMTRVLDRYRCVRCKYEFTVSRETGKVVNEQAREIEKPTRRTRNERTGFLCFAHQNKETLMQQALLPKYHQISLIGGNMEDVKFVLTDSDVMGRANRLQKLADKGIARFFVYPHAARPNLFNDYYEPSPHTTAMLVSARGHIEILRSFGYPKSIEVIGWHLCPIQTFHPRPDPRKILFAPIHPKNADIDRDVNQRAFALLCHLAHRDLIHLTVRHIGPLSGSGLVHTEHPNIEYVQGQANGSYEQIDKADVVVAHQTYAYMAVARGVPTVMMAEDMPTHFLNGAGYYCVRSWDKYGYLLQFPLDILKEDDTMGLLRRAAACDEEIAEWRERMIGEQFVAEQFVKTIERYL